MSSNHNSNTGKRIARMMHDYKTEGRFKSRKQAIAFALNKAHRNGGRVVKRRKNPARTLLAKHAPRPELPLPYDPDFYGV